MQIFVVIDVYCSLLSVSGLWPDLRLFYSTRIALHWCILGVWGCTVSLLPLRHK